MSGLEPLLEAIGTDVTRRVRQALDKHGERRLLDRSGVAKYLSISADMVDELRARGVLPKPVPLAGRKPLWDIRDLDALVERLKGGAA
jgi:predicted DNA-binding transcriptional regulator AlpA